MKTKLCILYSIAPRYREAIFKAIDNEYDCDWYFGQPKTDIKHMDYSLLNSVRFVKQFGNISKLYWKNTISTLFKKEYNVYLTLLESRALSDYVFLFLKRLFFPKKKIYIWTHGWYGKEHGIEAKLKLWQFKNVDGIFVYSNYSRNLLIENGISEDKVFTIHNSLHYEEQIALRNTIKPSSIYADYFSNDNPVIVFIGRLTKVKQLDMLVQAVSDLKCQGFSYNLVFVGDGIERENLELKTAGLGIKENVWFYGACYDEKKNAELIYNADLCVAPGNVGLTAMHTMVFGTPVISHNDFAWQMPEFEAIVPEKTGSFFERGSVDSLASSIKQWFELHSADRDEVRKACYNEIDTSWNPVFQMTVIRKYLK